MLSRVLFLGALVFVIVVVGATQAAVVTQYSFDGNLNDTATAGTTADNLTDNAGAAYTAGVVGSAVVIPDTADGSNKLTASSSGDLNLAANWTLEAFVWPDAGNDPAAEWERVWTKWGEGGDAYHVSFRGATGQPVPDGIDLFVNGGANIINHNSTATVPREAWSHVALVGDQSANTITAWLNGAEVGSTDYVTVTPNEGNMNFGNFADGNQAGFQYSGFIDDALIHDVAVDASYLASRTALIPEPSTGLLLLLAAAGCINWRRRR